MSQEFPTASLDITEDFHILHIAYVYICYSILKAKTYNWLPNTHTHTHTKQLGTSHLLLMVISLAQKLLSFAKFRTLRVIKNNIILLTLDWLWRPARRLCSNEGMFEAFALVWQTAQNGRLHKTGGTYYQSCMYHTDSAWLTFLMPFLLLYQYLAIFPAVLP